MDNRIVLQIQEDLPIEASFLTTRILEYLREMPKLVSGLKIGSNAPKTGPQRPPSLPQHPKMAHGANWKFKMKWKFKRSCSKRDRFVPDSVIRLETRLHVQNRSKQRSQNRIFFYCVVGRWELSNTVCVNCNPDYLYLWYREIYHLKLSSFVHLSLRKLLPFPKNISIPKTFW